MFPAATPIGSFFKFRVIAFNLQGAVISIESAALPMANIPGIPLTGPHSDALETNGNQIKVVYDPVADDGGSPLLSYELQIGSLLLNDFVEVVGGSPYSLQTYFTVTQGILKGETYAFRYRAINAIGFGPWSAISKLDAATVPIPPPKPYYISSTDTSITIGLKATLDNGGSRIL